MNWTGNFEHAKCALKFHISFVIDSGYMIFLSHYSLLKTVPADVLEKGRAMADAYRTSEEDTELENLDPESKKLESIL